MSMITNQLQPENKVRVLILVKALPQPSKNYGETVCCAGITVDGQWKRLFPVRFRHLSGDAAFRRWEWVEFRYRRPTSDARRESCHVFEDTIERKGSMDNSSERARLLHPILRGSAKEAMAAGESLTLIRPKNSRFFWKKRESLELANQREAFKMAARQFSIFDASLAAIEPSPFDFRFRFEDQSGKHDYANADWEAHAMFFNHRSRTSEAEALRWMDEKFNDEYPRKGMAFALGNVASRPHTWQLLGVVRLDEITQTDFGF